MKDILDFQEGTRRVWMFPRNIRDISPWKLYKILRVLMICSDVNQYSKDEQPTMYRLLSESGIKRPDNTRDINPGGLRTYYSQLEALGLVYAVDSDKTFHYTIAGEAILNEENPLMVLQCQLLRHQYPSAYGCGQNVRIDSRMRVKPFLFILKLLHDERIGKYLTNEDIVFPVIYGHSSNCYEFVVEKIVAFRKSKNFDSVIDNPSQDLYTPRGRLQNALNNIKDIGNTALNYLKASELVIVSDEKINNKSKYIFNANYEALFQNFIGSENSFIPIESMEQYQSFQRAYGRYNKLKDTRSDTRGIQYLQNAQNTFIQTKYVDYINSKPFDNSQTQFVAEMHNFGFPEDAVLNAIKPYLNKKKTLEENRYIEFANSGGVFSREFEIATTQLLVSYGFNKSQWTGSKKPRTSRIGGFADIFISYDCSSECGLADTKSSAMYELTHADKLVMSETYAKTYREIDDNSVLSFIVYIAGGFKGNINNAVFDLANRTGIPVTAINAENLLMIKELKMKGWTAEDIKRRIFSLGKEITKSIINSYIEN